MQHPADGVTDEFGLGETAVATFMCYDPQPGSGQTRAETVENPQGPVWNVVESRVREGDVLGRDKGLSVDRRSVDGVDEENILQGSRDVGPQAVKNEGSMPGQHCG